jgi:dihydroxy-acid dehydratase
MAAQWYDANISIPGCDKNMPGCMIAIGRLNRPALMIYGGTIRAGHGSEGEKLDIVSAFQSYGELLGNSIDENKRLDIIEHACPGAGACGGMYTANTMASAIEAMGMSLPYSSSTPAEDPAKHEECLRAGDAIKLLLEKDIKPRDIMTREAFENAMVTIMALGGSTNAVLHLVAMARAVDVPLTIDDFQTVSDRVPFLADLKPSGQYVMEDLHEVGGTPAVLRYLLAHGALHGDCLTVTGKTLAENLADLPDLTDGHKEGFHFKGPAKVFDCEEDMLAAMERGEISKGNVVVIRYEGPKGGPGMPEMLSPTSVIMGAGLGQDVALITDGRFSGGSHGFIIGHITPEAQEGGPIALVCDGDIIAIDAEKRSIDVEVDETEMAKRRAAWKAPELKAKRGTLYKYIKNVKSASEGCVTDE